MNRKIQFKYYFKKSSTKIFALIIFIFFLIPFVSNAATISVSPNNNTVSVGNIITLNFNVNTTGISINNAEVTVQYPTDLLEAVSVSKNNSIFSLWVEDPKFSNANGKITFNGGIATPGYNGTNGNMASVTFKAKKTGTASIIFTDASVRANDGLGTDVLSNKNNGIITIDISKEEKVSETILEKSDLPETPKIISNSHPNQDLWYTNNTATFEWRTSSAITSIQTSINQTSNSTPTNTYDSSVSQKTINNLNDGTYYFHLRYANAKGWGKTAHYKINIDATSPSSFKPSIRTEDNKNYIKLNAVDETSGIDYYLIKIDEKAEIKVKKTELINNEFILPAQNKGTHDVKVTAFDKAQNQITADLSFTSFDITAPILSIDKEVITKGKSVLISGKSDYAGEKVKVTLNIDNKQIGEYIQNISADGTFSIKTNKIKQTGTIVINGVNILSESVYGDRSENLYLTVNQKPIVMVSIAAFWLILLLLLIIILILILYVGWHKYFGLRKTIEKGTKDVILNIHKEMTKLKDELSEEILSLEKVKSSKDLDKKDEKIFNSIKKNIQDVDDFIDKKLKKWM